LSLIRARSGLFSFCGGILCLLVLIVLYVVVEERVGLKVVAILLTVYALLPALYWVWQLIDEEAAARKRLSASADHQAVPAPGQQL
jgi:hypothetical protein